MRKRSGLEAEAPRVPTLSMLVGFSMMILVGIKDEVPTLSVLVLFLDGDGEGGGRP